MTKTSVSLEYNIAQKFINEFISKNRSIDIPAVLVLISESYGEKISYDVSNITERQVLTARSLLDMLRSLRTTFSVHQFIDYAKSLYDVYITTVDIFLTSDTQYTPEVKDRIADMCMKICGVKKFNMHENISADHGGGFIVRFRDYLLDASYLRQLN